MGHNTKSLKPAKPRPDFPLFPHATRRWAKKVRGKVHYFGPWEDPDGALRRWLDQKDYLLAGRRPPANPAGLRIKDLANRFLTAKTNRVAAGELTERSFGDYKGTCDVVVEAFGKERLLEDLGPEDFGQLRVRLAKGRGAISLGNFIQRVRSLFKFAVENELIEKPIRFGTEFTKPNRKTLRLQRHAKGARMFEAAEILTMIEAASVQLQAMVLLGINCGFGNADCGNLPLGALDLAGGWVNYPRPKTGIERRAALWPETIEALKAVLKARKAPKLEADASIVFVTKRGGRWSKSTPDNPVAKETSKLLKSLELHRRGLGFYALRHTFETIAGESRDQVAVDAVMGHVDVSMAAHYREKISDERLRAVSDHVHAWLYAPATKTKPR